MSLPTLPLKEENGNRTGWGYAEIPTLQFQDIFAFLKQLCMKENISKLYIMVYRRLACFKKQLGGSQPKPSVTK